LLLARQSSKRESSFGENEICYPELVDDGINGHDGHLTWLHGIANEIGLELESYEEQKAA